MKSLLLFVLYLVFSCFLINVTTKALLKSKNSEPVIGFDLGDTNSCVGVFLNGKVEVLKSERENIVTPSKVAFTRDGRRLVGEAAVEQERKNLNGTIKYLKSMVGADSKDGEMINIQKWAKFIVDRNGTRPLIKVEVKGKTESFLPEDIAGILFENLKGQAEKTLQREVKNAVVTVPVYFKQKHREGVAQALKLAGLNVLNVVPVPIAAAAAYNLDRKNITSEILVFDMGGSNLEVSILRNDFGNMTILTNNTNRDLGGQDLNWVLREEFIKIILNEYQIDYTKDLRAIWYLQQEAKRVKDELCFNPTASFHYKDKLNGINIDMEYTRVSFEQLVDQFFKKIKDFVELSLKRAKIKISEIDQVILVGGSSNIPKLQKMINQLFEGKELFNHIQPQTVGAYGATLIGNRKK